MHLTAFNIGVMQRQEGATISSFFLLLRQAILGKKPPPLDSPSTPPTEASPPLNPTMGITAASWVMQVTDSTSCPCHWPHVRSHSVVHAPKITFWGCRSPSYRSHQTKHANPKLGFHLHHRAIQLDPRTH